MNRRNFFVAVVGIAGWLRFGVKPAAPPKLPTFPEWGYIGQQQCTDEQIRAMIQSELDRIKRDLSSKPKPKIDVNVTIMQIKQMLRRICESQGIRLPE